jgi:hypothetical protein
MATANTPLAPLNDGRRLSGEGSARLGSGRATAKRAFDLELR